MLPPGKTDDARNRIIGRAAELMARCKTLENLNALVEQYQEIRKPEGNASMAVQRVWKPIFLRNYQKIWWTSEGGNIEDLRNMLEMHVNSINLTLQALQRYVVSTASGEPATSRITQPRLTLPQVCRSPVWRIPSSPWRNEWPPYTGR